MKKSYKGILWSIVLALAVVMLVPLPFTGSLASIPVERALD